MVACIKLMRIGKKGYPTYRIVIIDKRKKRNTNYLDKIGLYNPHTTPPTINLDEKKLKDWLIKGVLVSEGVRKLLSKKVIR